MLFKYAQQIINDTFTYLHSFTNKNYAGNILFAFAPIISPKEIIRIGISRTILDDVFYEDAGL